jgi:DNA repair protein RecO (recombination protein O)
LIPRIATGESALAALVHWEVTVLADLGYGLDFSACAVTGQTEGLAFVSPRTGRAVTAEGAGAWQSRLLPLPEFLLGPAEAGMADIRDGLRLTGHFLARDAFGHHHRPLPQARLMLYDRISAMADRLDSNPRSESLNAG